MCEKGAPLIDFYRIHDVPFRVCLSIGLAARLAKGALWQIGGAAATMLVCSPCW